MVSKGIPTKKENESIKRELMNLLKENNDVEKQGLNKAANNVLKPQEAICLINRYECII